ncbi:hypothetical protein [Halorubrum tailed virus BLv36]|nr:hypothetical protein [Halorubrum tailed virus BLv36]
MDVTLTHNGRNDSLTFPILTESGTPQFSIDIGKPEVDIYEHGELQPRFNDTRSGLENYSITSQLRGASAYDDAILLADMIKSRQGNNEELELNVSGTNLDGYPTSPVFVAPAAEQEEAISLTYAPGRTNVVDVEGSFTRVNQVRGTANQNASTPTDSGSGPITLSDGTDTVELTEDIVVTRSVGRPNSPIRSTPRTHPNYTDQRKSAYDAFDIQFQMFDSGPSKAFTLARNLIQPQLGRSSLTLDFNGLFNLGSFNVIPSGSQAFRFQRIAGQKDVENAPTLSLRRVI